MVLSQSPDDAANLKLLVTKLQDLHKLLSQPGVPALIFYPIFFIALALGVTCQLLVVSVLLVLGAIMFQLFIRFLIQALLYILNSNILVHVKSPIVMSKVITDKSWEIGKPSIIVWEKKAQTVATLTIISLLVLDPSAQAGNGTWANTGSTDGKWSDASNWASGSVPGSTFGTSSSDVATFNTPLGTFGTTLNPIVIDSTTQNIGGITFTGGAGNFTIGSAVGSNSLYLTSGGTIQINNALTSTNAVETINAPLIIAGINGTYKLTNNSSNGTGSGAGTLNVAGGITGSAIGSTVLTINGSNTNLNTISGVISNGSATSMAVTKSGTGTWVLTGANTYSGATTVSGGTLQVGNGVSGSIAFGSPVSVSSGATLAVDESTLSVMANSISNSGTISGVQGSGIVNDLSGVMSGTGNFTQNGAGGTIFLNGGNTFSGGVTVNSGSVTAGFGSTTLGSGSNETIVQGALGTGVLTDNGGIVDLGGNNVAVGGLSGTGGTIGSSSVLTNSNFTIVTNGSTSYAGTITNAVGVGVAEDVSLTIAGTGSETLTGTNTYTGATTVNSGSLIVGGSGSLQYTGAINVTGGSLLFNKGTAFNTLAPVTLGGTASSPAVLGYTSTSAAGGVVNLGTLSLISGSVSAIDFGSANVSTIGFYQGTASIGLSGSTVLDVYHYVAGDNLDFLGSSVPNGGDSFNKVEFFSGAVGSNTAIGYGQEVSFGGGYQVVPTPEISTLYTALCFLGLLGYATLHSRSV